MRLVKGWNTIDKESALLKQAYGDVSIRRGQLLYVR